MIRNITSAQGINMADEISVPESTVPDVPVVSEMPTDKEIQAAYMMGALQDKIDQANQYYGKVMEQITNLKDNKMAEIMTPSMIMGGGGDGGLGFGSGGGLIGGLILGSLLRNGNGGLFGGENGGVAGAVLRNPPEQNQANMDLMAGIGAVDKSVAVSTATMEASQATQTLGITSQLNSITQALAARVEGVKEAVMATAAQTNQNIMENRYVISQNISNDGEKTRALITQQYEQNLTRQLQEANAALIELRSQQNIGAATRGVEITTTNNINQMQQQAQQQAQFGQLANLIYGLGQSIRSTNEAINVGSGTLTANPSNTNTNIR